MAFDFTRESPVLSFGPRHHARWCDRRFLLWPAWAYRVVAPRIRQRCLNVLQRAVMGLCRAGLVRPDTLAEHLSIHPDLAAFIMKELGDLRYVDTNGLPTSEGIRILDDDSIDTHEMVAGYVFQDPWRQDLWPRFVERLDYCELDYDKNGFPVLVTGTTGKPRRFPAFAVLPRANVGVPATPSSKAIVEAVTRHRKRLRFNDADDTDEGPIGKFDATGVQIRRVNFVEETPQPVFLTTYLYVPESDSGAMDWYVCDPFGLGQSVRLRRGVEQVMHDEVPALYEVVNKLIGQTLQGGYEEHRRWLDTLHLQAGLEVDRRLTVNIRSHAGFDQLIAMEAARQEVRAFGPECPERKINEVLRAGVKVLESVFASMATAHPFGDIWKRTYVVRTDRRTGSGCLRQQRDAALLAALYESAIRGVGFSGPIPQAFLNVPPGQIRSVAEFGQHWRLRPLVTATVLLADRERSHPLRDIAHRNPTLLNLVDQIAISGGAAGHAGGTNATVADTEEHADRVYHVVSELVGLSEAETNNSTEAAIVNHE